MQLNFFTFGRPKNVNLRQVLDSYLDIAGKKQRQFKVQYVALGDKTPDKAINPITVLYNHQLSGTHTWFLAEWGEQFKTSKDFQTKLKTYWQDDQDLNIVCGNAFGWESVPLLAPHKFISLSGLTYNHELASVMLAEQVFRFADYLVGGKYSK